MKYDLIIKNGFVVLPDCVKQTSIGIKGGKIVSIGELGSDHTASQYDALGKLVFPGGIDVHVHFSDLGAEELENWEDGSLAAASGGITTVADMPIDNVPATTTKDAFYKKLERIEGNSYVDYLLWGGVTKNNSKQLIPMLEAGATGFKTFLTEVGREDMPAPDEKSLREAMEVAARYDVPMMVHAEDQEMNTRFENLYKATKDWNMWSKMHPISGELKAIQRCIHMAKETGARIHIAHVSLAAAIDAIWNAKKEGVRITCETGPHYLLFSEEDYKEKGALLKCTPPVRDAANKEKLWQYVLEGRIDMISSDHSPSESKHKEDSVCDAWAGVSGVQMNLITLLSEGYLKRGMDLNLIANMHSLNPARFLGLSDEIGSIEVGKKANIIIANVNTSYIMSENDLRTKNKSSVYCQTEFHASIEKTYLHGSEIVLGSKNGAFIRKG